MSYIGVPAIHMTSPQKEPIAFHPYRALGKAWRTGLRPAFGGLWQFQCQVDTLIQLPGFYRLCLQCISFLLSVPSADVAVKISADFLGDHATRHDTWTSVTWQYGL